MAERQPVWRQACCQGGGDDARPCAGHTGAGVPHPVCLPVGFGSDVGHRRSESGSGAILAIVGNAYLATAMLLAVFTFYHDGLRRSRPKTQGAQAEPLSSALQTMTTVEQRMRMTRGS